MKGDTKAVVAERRMVSEAQVGVFSIFPIKNNHFRVVFASPSDFNAVLCCTVVFCVYGGGCKFRLLAHQALLKAGRIHPVPSRQTLFGHLRCEQILLATVAILSGTCHFRPLRSDVDGLPLFLCAWKAAFVLFWVLDDVRTTFHRVLGLPSLAFHCSFGVLDRVCS